MLLKKGISVIVPTYNRRDLLDRTLLSLSLQLFNPYDYEVIVIDDGSTDDTKDIVLSYKDRMLISYMYQEDKGFRVAQARNLGILNARYSVCLFLDSGVIAHPSLLARHWRAYLGKSEQVLIGFAYGYCDYEELALSLLKDFNNRSEIENIFCSFRNNKSLRDRRSVVLDNEVMAFESISIPWIIFWTCHVSCTTKSLLKVKGFDENFQSWGGEDIELGLRLHAAGVHFDLARDCEVIHWPHVRTAIPPEHSNQYAAYIYKKHPANSTFMLMQGRVPWIDIVKEENTRQGATLVGGL